MPFIQRWLERFFAWVNTRRTAWRVAKFWEWFAPYAPAYLTLHTLPRAEADAQVQHLLAALREVHPSLSAEIEKLGDAEYSMVITARGDREAFDAVRALVAAAPPLSGWAITAFRQPRPVEMLEFPLEEGMLSHENVWYVLTPQPDFRLVDAMIFVVADIELSEEITAKIGYSCLDAAIGEVNVATKLGQVQFYYWPRAVWDGKIDVFRRHIGEVSVECKPIAQLKDDFEPIFKEVLT